LRGWGKSHRLRVLAVVVNLSHQSCRFAHRWSNSDLEFAVVVCPLSGLDSCLPCRLFGHHTSSLVAPVLVPEVSYLFLHPLHLFLKFLHELCHIVVFVAEARWLTPVDLFCFSAGLVSSRSFWEPVGSLFVSEVHVALIVEACTPVHGHVRGGCCRRRC